MSPNLTQVGVCKNPDGAGFGWNILLGSGKAAAKKRKATENGSEDAKKMKVVRFDNGDDSDGGSAEGDQGSEEENEEAEELDDQEENDQENESDNDDDDDDEGDMNDILKDPDFAHMSDSDLDDKLPLFEDEKSEDEDSDDDEQQEKAKEEAEAREERRAKAVEEGAEAYMDSMMKAVGKRKTEVDDEASVNRHRN